MKEDLYKEDVIAPGDKASKLAAQVCYGSHKNCSALTVVPHQPGNFRGPVGWVWKKHILEMMANHELDNDGNVITWEMLEEKENDGAGGKPMMFTVIGKQSSFAQLGWEPITMCIDDFSRSGRFPAIIANDINVKKITDENYPLFESMINGYGDILKQSNLVNITGEVAVMKFSITAFCDESSDFQLILIWGASCVGLCHKDKLIDGSRIRPGMPIVGFHEPGYRCNGGTFFVNLINAEWGLEVVSSERFSFIEKLVVPSKSYARFITHMHGWNDDGSIKEPLVNMVGIAHITGGGVWEKFGELLPDGVGANLSKMPKPANVLLEAQELSWKHKNLRLSDWQAYSTLHGGCGMLIVCENFSDAEMLIHQAGYANINAQIVGETTSSITNEIIIHSRFKEEKILSSHNPE
jgi:phosphoribosylformylglycinamidine cyclo-ligase